MLYHATGAKPPKKANLLGDLEDGSYLTATTQMWGAFELYERGEERNRETIRDMRTTPVEPAFAFDYFSALIDEFLEGKKRSAKCLLTNDQLIPLGTTKDTKDTKGTRAKRACQHWRR